LRLCAALAVALATTLAAAARAGAEQASYGGPGPSIVNGLDTQDFPTTGALLYSFNQSASINGSNAGTQCTGTLIGCQTFMTAAHCVFDDPVASHYWVYLQNGGISQVASVTYNPSYNPSLSGHDVAILKLSTPVTGIDPTTFNSTHDLAAIGVAVDGVIAGFGRTGGSGAGTSDYGIKRYGDIVTAHCNTADTGGEGDDKLVCWDFTSPEGPAGSNSDTCNGDSGGPLFMNFGGTTEVVANTVSGTSDSCLPTDHSWDSGVYFNRTWIGGELGTDSTSTCGSIGAVGDATVSVFQNHGSLSSAHPGDSFTVTLAGTPSVVRFTLNGTDNRSFNPNFFVKQGPGASPASYDCKEDGTSVFGACVIPNPAPGAWSVFVQRAAGAGDYQVTTTAFGTSAPVCGNNVKESGEQCDGSDAVACPGMCSVGCACPAPVCGNGVKESGEQCDGSDATACPGQCAGDCTCPDTCNSGDLYSILIGSDAVRFTYKADLNDAAASYSALDPRNADFSLSVNDGTSTLSFDVPSGDAGWIRADPVRRRYLWKGDGSLGGLVRIKLVYRSSATTPYWLLGMKGRNVPGGGSLDVNQTLHFTLDFDGTCNLDTW
jgi:hypothetical protein